MTIKPRPSSNNLNGPSVGASCLVTDILVLVFRTTEKGYQIRSNRSQWFDAKKATLTADQKRSWSIISRATIFSLSPARRGVYRVRESLDPSIVLPLKPASVLQETVYCYCIWMSNCELSTDRIRSTDYETESPLGGVK